MLKLGQRGDTIVEVMVCIAIVSLILAGAYATTNRSSIGVRDSQEHAEALKLAESQLEQLRQSGNSAKDIFTTTTPFCMVSAAPVQATGVTAPECVQNSAGAPTTGQPAYHLTINRTNSINSGFLFTVLVQWASVTGHGNNQETLAYRLYE